MLFNVTAKTKIMSCWGNIAKTEPFAPEKWSEIGVVSKPIV